MLLQAKSCNAKLFFILFIALTLRLGALAAVPQPPLDTSAEVAYWGGAHLLSQGKGFSDQSYPVYAPPFYAVFIAACLKLFGDNHLSVILPQILFDSLTSVSLYVCMSQIFGQRVGLVSGILWAIYPFSIYLSISIASEPLFTFLLSTFVVLITYALQSHKLYHYFFAGFALGLATLTRGVSQFIPIYFFLWFWFFNTTKRQLVTCYLLFCLSFVLVLSPWALRNYIVLEDFVPVATAGGVVFLQGSTEIFFSSDALEKWPSYYADLLSKSETTPPNGSKPSQIDRFNAQAGIQNYKSRVLNNPMSLGPFLFKKFLRLWYAGESGRNDKVILLINGPIYVLALAGAALALYRRLVFASVPFGIILYFVLVHWASLPLFRYMMPIMPYLFGFTALAIVALLAKYSSINLEEADSSRVMT